MSYTSYDFTRRDSRTDVYRDDRYTSWTDRRIDYWTDRRTDSRTYYNYNNYQRCDYSRDERRSRDRYSRGRYSSRRPRSRSRESRGQRRGEGGSSRPDDRRPRVSSHAEVECPTEVPESIFYPDLWSTHMTDADYAQMATWEDETRKAVQAEIRSTTQSGITKATVSHAVSPPNNRKRRHDAASFTSNYTTDSPPLPKRPKVHVNRHFYHRYGYHY